MRGKFVEGADNTLAIKLEPENSDEVLLLTYFMKDSHSSCFTVVPLSWGYNERVVPDRGGQNTLTSVGFHIVKDMKEDPK